MSKVGKHNQGSNMFSLTRSKKAEWMMSALARREKKGKNGI